MNARYLSMLPRQMFFLIAGVVLALALGLTPALSLDGGWAETEGGRMRLVVDPAPRQDGTFTGILDIELEPGWKTYWRDPGGSGIPPTLDVSQSEGVTLEAMHYPAPVRIDDGYAVWAGYTASPVQFPLTFRRIRSGDAQIHANVFVGICEKICVPFQAEFEIDLSEGTVTDDAAKATIRQAFENLPAPAGADFSVKKAVLDDDGSQIDISAQLPQFRPSGVTPELFVAGPAGFAFAPPKLVSEEGGSVRWTIKIAAMPAASKADTGENLDIVITLGQRSIGQTVLIKGL